MSSTQYKPFYPPQFNRFGKLTKDLFKKKYDFEHSVKTISRSTTNKLTIESGGVLQDAGALRGYIKANYPNFQYGSIDAELYTDAAAESKATLTLSNLPAGAALATTISSKDGKDKAFKGAVGSVEAQYRQEFVSAYVNAKTDLDVHKIDASVSVGYNGISIGGLATIDASNAADVQELNYGVEWEQPDYLCSIYTEKNGKKDIVSYFQRLSPSHVLGATFTIDSSSPGSSLFTAPRSLTIGNEYRVSADTVIKTKAEVPSGAVSSHIEHRLVNPRVLLGIAAASSIKTQKVNAVGVSLAFGDF